jgi:deoxycytidine triphosphate deaminase
MEKITLPSGKVSVDDSYPPMLLMANVFPRSTLQRCGLFLRTTKTDPGYTGELTFGLSNLGPSKIRLELGSRIANLVFQGVIGGLSREYGGQWERRKSCHRRQRKANLINNPIFVIFGGLRL